MTVKIWRVKFGSLRDHYTSVDVAAGNFKEAARKAQLHRKRYDDTYLNRTQDVESVELIAESD